MSTLQSCAKCGAQFDVSSMAAGTAFTCGACGGVVTVGRAAPAAAPTRVPPAPARAIPAPAAPARAIPAPAAKASARGPQYVPLERRREAAAEPPAKGRRAEREEAADEGRRGRRGRAEHGGKKGLSPAAMAGIAAGALVVVVGLALALSGGKKSGGSGEGTKTAGGGTTPSTATSPTAGTSPGTSPTATVKPGPNGATPAGGETVASVDAEFNAKRHWTNDELKKFFGRYQAVGSSATPRLKALAEQIVRDADADFAPARTLLGYKEFKHELPEIISFTKYPYLRAVEEANKHRWFGPDDEDAYQLAMAAWAKTLAHAKKLDPDTGDSTFRALDGARQSIARDSHFKDYNYEAIFASPYLICYSSDERLSEEELVALPKKERLEKLAELEKSRESFRRILAEKAKIYQQLYKHFLGTYGEACDLHDLMAPYGGANLGPGKRSFKDGCPLIIWIFSDKKAFQDYHDNVVKNKIHPGVAGYFSPLTGWVYLYDEAENREFEVNKNVHEGTHQLEHWFQKQKREWGMPRVPQSFFGEGFAEYVGSVNMTPDRTLTFHGVNRPRIEYLKSMKEALTKNGTPLSKAVFPTKELVGFEGYGSVEEWGGRNGIPNALLTFYAQSWAFVYFLNEAANHKYQARFNGYVDDMLNHPSNDDASGYALAKFKERFGIRSEDDWKKLHAEFQKYYLETIIPMDIAKLGASPPSRENWPGYQPIDPVDPTKDAPATADAAMSGGN